MNRIKENLVALLQSKTNMEGLADLPWKEVITGCVLPLYAGRPENRWRIADDFMLLMADHHQEFLTVDQPSALALMTLAMGRCSKGAVLHQDDPINLIEELPAEYRNWSAAYDDYGIMTKGVEQFILKAIPTCAKYARTREHALAICFGLIRNLYPSGYVDGAYMLGGIDYHPSGILLFETAIKVINENATKDEKVSHFMTPDQWQKHKDFFRELARKGELDWEKFFEATKANDVKGWLNKWKKTRAIKKELLAH